MSRQVRSQPVVQAEAAPAWSALAAIQSYAENFMGELVFWATRPETYMIAYGASQPAADLAYWELTQIHWSVEPEVMAHAIAQAEAAAVKNNNSLKTDFDDVPKFYVYRRGPGATREIWDNDFEAMLGNTKGHVPAPDELVYVPGVAKANRTDALKDVPTKKGSERDEYPYACTEQGGDKPWLRVAYVPPEENFIQSVGLNLFTYAISDGWLRSQVFLVVLVP